MKIDSHITNEINIMLAPTYLTQQNDINSDGISNGKLPSSLFLRNCNWIQFQFLFYDCYISISLESHSCWAWNPSCEWQHIDVLANVGKTFPIDQTDELMCNVQKCMESVRKNREDKNPMKIYIFRTRTSVESVGTIGTLNTNIWTKFVFTLFGLQHANCTYGFIQCLNAGATISE